MKILVTGASGLIGKALVEKLKQNHHEVRCLTRKKATKANEFHWNISENFIDERAFENLDIIIHLAGANISERWTASYKKELYSSRIDSANLLRKYCSEKNIRLKAFISASGINYYGTFTSDKILDETSGIIRHDFLAQLCVAWEHCADAFVEIAERVVCLRTAMVLAKNGGALPKLQKITNFNLASPVGSGKQWMNWIHIDDLVNLYLYAVENSSVNGKLNATTEGWETNSDFMKKLAQNSHKIFLPINIPSFVLKTAFGEMSQILLEGTRVSNKKIKSLGFDFKYEDLKSALATFQ